MWQAWDRLLSSITKVHISKPHNLHGFFCNLLENGKPVGLAISIPVDCGTTNRKSVDDHSKQDWPLKLSTYSDHRSRHGLRDFAVRFSRASFIALSPCLLAFRPWHAGIGTLALIYSVCGLVAMV